MRRPIFLPLSITTEVRDVGPQGHAEWWSRTDQNSWRACGYHWVWGQLRFFVGKFAWDSFLGGWGAGFWELVLHFLLGLMCFAWNVFCNNFLPRELSKKGVVHKQSFQNDRISIDFTCSFVKNTNLETSHQRWYWWFDPQFFISGKTCTLICW